MASPAPLGPRRSVVVLVVLGFLPLPPPPPGVVKQDKSSGGSVDTTKTHSGPQRVRMSGGERPIGAAKGTQSDTEALSCSSCPMRSPQPISCAGQPRPPVPSTKPPARYNGCSRVFISVLAFSPHPRESGSATPAYPNGPVGCATACLRPLLQKHMSSSGVLPRYPTNVTLSDLYYYVCCPTLCYELNFPRHVLLEAACQRGLYCPCGPCWCVCVRARVGGSLSYLQ